MMSAHYVEMNEVLSDWDYKYGVLGVTVQAPHTISLPYHVSGGLSCPVLIDYRHVLNQGTKEASGLGAPLRGVRAGSRVGLLVDGQGNLHLYVDGTDRGVFASAVPQPCYVLIDLNACWKKVTTLPLERVRK
ncbi:hypothetical protein ACOMHN_022230 [Nucella lapillus]